MRFGRAHLIRLLAIAGYIICTLPISTRAQSVLSQVGPINVESLARLDNPWAMAFLPDGRMLITEKPGRLRVYAEGRLSGPIGGVPRVAYRSQGGLLDVRIDPDFARNQLVYLSYVEAAEQQPPDAREEPDPRLGPFQEFDDTVLKGTTVARGRLVGNQLRDVTVIWRQVPKMIGRGHFGGRLVFAPDGKLFITSGERQRFEPAQDLRSNLGKIVRINPDGTIPADNQFDGRSDALPDIWTIGHRNPLGAAMHPSSQRLWINEMGPKGGDELNIIEKGRNYGWPIVSEGIHYNDVPIPRHATRDGYAVPIRTWYPSVSPSGLIFYTANRFQLWAGNALMGGLSSQALIRLTLDVDKVTGEERIAMNRRIRDVIQAPDGAVLLLSDGDNGELLRLTPARETIGTGRRN
jgi:glucose/arabinose dehydrogenase